MKLLNLVLTSDSTVYTRMYDILSIFYKKYANVTTFFYKYSDIQDDFLLEKDVLHIKGKETMIPGILEKTFKSFEIVQNLINSSEYDYIIRSTVATVIDFKKLENVLDCDYGGYMWNLQWIDPKCGIIDSKYHGVRYMSGTCIILSKRLMSEIIVKQSFLDKTVIDDVAIGALIRDHIHGKKYADLSKYFIFTEQLDSLTIDLIEKYIVFRNHHDNREIDVQNITLITNSVNV